MDSRRDITALILTYNEAPNLGRTLSRLHWAHEILIVDSFSTDGTVPIARAYPRTRVLQRRFDTFAGQCNFGLQHISTPWVLSLDADYVLTDRLVREITRLKLSPETGGYEARFRYCIFGRPLRSSFYPPRIVLHRRDSARYVDQGHSHRVRVEGRIDQLSGWIEHDDRKSLDRWLRGQCHYAAAEARYLNETPRSVLNRADRLRRSVVLAPFAVCFYALVVKGLLTGGWPAWYYVLHRVLSEIILSLYLLDFRLRPSPKPADQLRRVAGCDEQNLPVHAAGRSGSVLRSPGEGGSL